jgi:hypothetical protein
MTNPLKGDYSFVGYKLKNIVVHWFPTVTVVVPETSA